MAAARVTGTWSGRLEFSAQQYAIAYAMDLAEWSAGEGQVAQRIDIEVKENGRWVTLRELHADPKFPTVWLNDFLDAENGYELSDVEYEFAWVAILPTV